MYFQFGLSHPTRDSNEMHTPSSNFMKAMYFPIKPNKHMDINPRRDFYSHRSNHSLDRIKEFNSVPNRSNRREISYNHKYKVTSYKAQEKKS